jgi:O-antigen ligase
MNDKEKNWFDYMCDLSIIGLLTALFAFSTNAKNVFIPLEALFLATFGIRFLVRRSKLSLYTVWSIGLVVLALISTTYAPNESEARRLAISVIQVVLFGNLILPYLRDSGKNIHTLLHGIMFAAFALLVRILVSAPIEQLLSERWGPTVEINANQVGLCLAFGALVALYYGIAEKRYSYLVLMPIFALSSLFSGSRKAIVLILIGGLLLTVLTRKATLSSFLELCVLFLILLGIWMLAFKWDPLYKVLGSRIETFLSFFNNEETTDGSTSIRFEMIRNGFNLVLQRPLFGHGMASFKEISGYQFYSHNNYIEILVSWGFIGFVWYYGFLAVLFILGVKSFFSSQRTPLLILEIIILIVLVVDDIGRVRFYDEISHILFVLCYAVLLTQVPQEGYDLPSLGKAILGWIRHPRLSRQS